MDIRTLQVAAALMFERFCVRVGADHPAVPELVDYLFDLAVAAVIPDWHRRPIAIVEGILPGGMDASWAPDVPWPAVETVATWAEEVGMADLYGAITDRPREAAERVLADVTAAGVDVSDLRQLTAHRRPAQRGWGEVVALDRFRAWQELRAPRALDLAATVHDVEAPHRPATQAIYGEFAGSVVGRTDDDRLAHLLSLADELQERGDPRGELIALQHRVEVTNDIARSPQNVRLAQLMEDHRDEWIPVGLDRCPHDLAWCAGFIDAIELSGSRIGRAQWAAWLRHPSLCCVRELALHDYAIFGLPTLPASVCSLRLTLDRPDDLSSTAADLIGSWAPDLDCLAVAGVSIAGIEPWAVPELRQLAVTLPASPVMAERMLADLIAAPLLAAVHELSVANVTPAHEALLMRVLSRRDQPLARLSMTRAPSAYR